MADDEIRDQFKATTSDYDREKLGKSGWRSRTGGVAVIRVRAPSREMRWDERLRGRDQRDQAVMAEGIVPGGGLALLCTI